MPARRLRVIEANRYHFQPAAADSDPLATTRLKHPTFSSLNSQVYPRAFDSMARGTLNVLITSFSGLGLPPTLSLQTAPSSTITELRQCIDERLPTTSSRFILTTLSNKQLPVEFDAPVAGYLSNPDDDLLSLRLGVPLCGGKGGFGSQLRAAGGRMSSKKKKDQNTNGSSRNLDGRRLRTVDQAKSLAEYLAIEPEMTKQAKEKRRERQEQIIAAADKKEEELKNAGKATLDSQFLEDFEDSNERTREIMAAAMKSGAYKDNLIGTSARSSSSKPSDKQSGSEDGNEASSKASTPPSETVQSSKAKGKAPAFFGFDEDDEFMSSGEEEDEEK